jgi:hypothetical protein
MHIINPTTVNQGSHLVLSLFTLTNTDTPADTFCSPLTTNFVHCICAPLTNIIDTTPDFTPLIKADPNKVYIPQNNKQDKANLKLNLVVTLLCNIPQAADREFKRFIRYRQDFFLKGNVLWHKNFHSFHKVAILPACCLLLITQVHDYVGHHGTYPVCSHLIERFWWPHLQSDVKWFVTTKR